MGIRDLMLPPRPNLIFTPLHSSPAPTSLSKSAILILPPPKAVDPAANFAAAEAHIRKAAAAGCHLAVLPEYHLTSWVPEDPGFIAACAASEAYLEDYRALARELDISIVPGTICEAHPATEHAPPEPAGEGEARELLRGKELRNSRSPCLSASFGALL